MKHTAARSYRAVRWLHTRAQKAAQEATRRPEGGDISITTVIIWVASVTGALVIAGTIAAVINRYNLSLSGI
ncbi:hypothetical protein [Streptomyces himalayensis]|uniref:DUF2970 domain-containing protein n=1 Tax=Streptomyces himalayensis subsp. himalayensis TaxID=2756131 RepID=A0A7W0DR00_9ACTN|nr:hypothetical protein [Streptomyces himalayensis]MBA2949630.1 hypothetical protein [Streptomyces himalayensis subsp. himalayensis]